MQCFNQEFHASKAFSNFTLECRVLIVILLCVKSQSGGATYCSNCLADRTRMTAGGFGYDKQIV